MNGQSMSLVDALAVLDAPVRTGRELAEYEQAVATLRAQFPAAGSAEGVTFSTLPVSSKPDPSDLLAVARDVLAAIEHGVSGEALRWRDRMTLGNQLAAAVKHAERALAAPEPLVLGETVHDAADLDRRATAGTELRDDDGRLGVRGASTWQITGLHGNDYPAESLTFPVEITRVGGGR